MAEGQQELGVQTDGWGEVPETYQAEPQVREVAAGGVARMANGRRDIARRRLGSGLRVPGSRW